MPMQFLISGCPDVQPLFLLKSDVVVCVAVFVVIVMLLLLLTYYTR